MENMKLKNASTENYHPKFYISSVDYGNKCANLFDCIFVSISMRIS